MIEVQRAHEIAYTSVELPEATFFTTIDRSVLNDRLFDLVVCDSDRELQKQLCPDRDRGIGCDSPKEHARSVALMLCESYYDYARHPNWYPAVHYIASPESLYRAISEYEIDASLIEALFGEGTFVRLVPDAVKQLPGVPRASPISAEPQTEHFKDLVTPA